MDESTDRFVTVRPPFSLAVTCGPVHWTTNRSPRHRWDHGVLTWVGWEGETDVWRRCWQVAPDRLAIEGTADSALDASWARDVLGCDIGGFSFQDPVIAAIDAAYPGLHPFCDGSVFDGVITAIVGQSISVAAAAITQAKLAALFGGSVRVGEWDLVPLPRADQLAEASAQLIRSSGVTWKRAEAIRFAAQAAMNGELPDDDLARRNPDQAVQALLALPLVGRWTAESVVLWGVGAPNAHPTGDVALLRAAKHAFGRPELTLKTLDVLAEQWQPARAIAARLLWTELFGAAPLSDQAPASVASR